jgi:branched-chain amino acid transport system permease protein
MMTTIFSALSDGALYAIAGIVLTVPLVRCGIVNFAQAFYIVLGEYLVVSMTGAGWAVIPMLVVLLALGGVLGAAQEILTVRPTRGRHETTLVTTVGMGIAVEGFILAEWGPNPKSVSFFGGSNPVHIFGGVLQPFDLWLIGLAIVAGVVFELAVRRTRWGVLGRAAMTDQTAAMLRGVNIPRLRTTAFALAGALSCALSLFVAPKTGVTVDNALHLVVFSFAAAAIGGFGSFTGTAAGGFLIGFVEAFSSRYLNVDWVAILVFAILCSVLVVRPRGLFGPRHLRLV